MTNQELYEEIKELRKEIREDLKALQQDFFLFKGKAFGFISLLSVVTSLAFNYLIKK